MNETEKNCKKCFHKNICTYRDPAEDDVVCNHYVDRRDVKIINKKEKE